MRIILIWLLFLLGGAIVKNTAAAEVTDLASQLSNLHYKLYTTPGSPICHDISGGSADPYIPAELSGEDRVTIRVERETIPDDLFMQKDAETDLLNYIRTAAIEWCEKQGGADFSKAYVIEMGSGPNIDGGESILVAISTAGPNASWKFIYDGTQDAIKNKMLAAEADIVAMVNEGDAINKAKQDIASFNALGNPKHLALATYQANPFAYQGKTIGMVVEFVKMLSPNEAVFFDQTSDATLYVDNIPTTAITVPEEMVALSVTGEGTEELANNITLPAGQFIGFVPCNLDTSPTMCGWFH